MLSSLLLSSSGRAELSRIELGSGRAFKFEPRVVSCRVGLASFITEHRDLEGPIGFVYVFML